jgi:hypothetical protein
VAATLVFAGDTSLGDWYLSRGKLNQRHRLQEEPLSFAKDIRALISEKALLIVNLETVLSRDPEKIFSNKAYMGWDDPVRTTTFLKELEVDAVSLANNHTMDFGPKILSESTRVLRNAHIHPFGAGETLQEAARPFRAAIQSGGSELSVYVVAGMTIKPVLRDQYAFYAAQTQGGVNPISVPRIVGLIQGLRYADPTALIIAYPHWGENYEWANAAMKRLSTAILNAGADLILGHGAHMLQECRVTASGTVIFSLGNFIFNSGGRYGKLKAPPYSLVSRLELDCGVERRAALRLYPIVSDNKRTGYTPRPVDREEAGEVFALMKAKAPDAEKFSRRFRLALDARGWHLSLRRPLSPRFGLLADE